MSSQGAPLQKIHLELGKDGGVIFIDEIQRKENAGLFLKGLYDQDLPWKFVVSGSGSIELKEKISESLAGRKRMFELSTVSFGEFLDFKTGYRYTDKLREFFRSEPTKTDQLFREYLMYGGYPRVILAGTHQSLGFLKSWTGGYGAGFAALSGGNGSAVMPGKRTDEKRAWRKPGMGISLKRPRPLVEFRGLADGPGISQAIL